MGLFATLKTDLSQDLLAAMGNGFTKMESMVMPGFGGQIRRLEEETAEQFKEHEETLENIKTRLRRLEGDTQVFRAQLETVARGLAVAEAAPVRVPLVVDEFHRVLDTGISSYGQRRSSRGLRRWQRWPKCLRRCVSRRIRCFWKAKSWAS